MQTLWDYAENEQPEQSGGNDANLEAIRQEILERVSSYKVDTVRDKVAWILNHYPDTRNSDIALQLKYWETFEPNLYTGGPIHPDRLYELTRLTTIARARAKVQNEYRLFLASPEIRAIRGKMSDEEEQKAAEDKPAYPAFSVYMDDSGKTGHHMLVGSIWILSDFYAVHSAIYDLVRTTELHEEFHFKNLEKQHLPLYREVVDRLWQHSNTLGFKLLSVPRAGLEKGGSTITDMYYHLLLKGIEHEQESNRAPLPRELSVWIDAEGASLDKLRVANLEDRLKQASQLRFGGQLALQPVSAVDSKNNIIIQIADLFTGSVNRLLNHSGTTRNHKDDFAEYFLDRFGINPELPENDTVGDLSVHLTV